MSRFIVAARSDGRGGFRPFGSYGAPQRGASVSIGEHRYTVGVDGRVNIPKAVMEQYGVRGDDGRMRVAIEFASQAGADGWGDVGAVVSRPSALDKNAQTGSLAGKISIFDPDFSALEPYDSGEYNWSP